MRLFTVKQIRQLDQKTLDDHKMPSIELMEHAAVECVQWMQTRLDKRNPVVVVAGVGNNGGDGVAIARMLHFSGFPVKLYAVGNTGRGTPDFHTNYTVLKQRFPGIVIAELPDLDEETTLVDAIFGSGLSRPVKGEIAEVIERINQAPSTVISIDIPSGMPTDPVSDPENYTAVVRANTTLTLQFPKINMLLADHGNYVGEMVILPIGISEKAIATTPSHYQYTELNDISDTIKPRPKFTHKGMNGHVLILAGSNGMAGAAGLCARAALRSGAGLVTVSAPVEVTTALQVYCPEAICRNDLPDVTDYDCVAIGPGIGYERFGSSEIIDLIRQCRRHGIPIVIDADGLNVLASGQDEWPEDLFKSTVITPHPKEFDRIAGECRSHGDRLKQASDLALNHETIVVLKGAYTSVHSNGSVYFNSTGNPGMATAGSGDVLTGVLGAILAGHEATPGPELVRTAVFVHGLAGDLACKEIGGMLIASDIIDYLPAAFRQITSASARPPINTTEE